MEQKYFICKHCGNIVSMVKSTGVPIICCGEPMAEMVPGETDGALEKHVPVYEVSGNKVTVKVGEVEHPMVEEHFIQWVSLQTKQGSQMKALKPGEKPEATFCLSDGDEVEAVFEYCNLHGLWKK